MNVIIFNKYCLHFIYYMYMKKQMTALFAHVKPFMCHTNRFVQRVFSNLKNHLAILVFMTLVFTKLKF